MSGRKFIIQAVALVIIIQFLGKYTSTNTSSKTTFTYPNYIFGNFLSFLWNSARQFCIPPVENNGISRVTRFKMIVIEPYKPSPTHKSTEVAHIRQMLHSNVVQFETNKQILIQSFK